MIQLILCMLFTMLAGACYAVCWKLQFHYYNSAFWNLNKEHFWNPTLSWRNKWSMTLGQLNKDANGKHIERFWGSSRWFVFLTDGFHLFQFLALWFLAMATSILLYEDMLQFTINVVAFRVLFSGTFTLFFDYLLKKHDNN